MEYQWISLSGKVWAPRCPMHPLWWSSHPDSTEWQPAMWAKTHCDESQPASWATTRIFKGISEPHIWTYLGPQPCPLNLFFSKAPASVCVSVWPSCRSARLPRNPNRPPGLRSASPPACHCSALCTTLACFVNNHLFVAGIAAAITSDLPVSSIMERLLDVNICKSLLLNSPPG